MPAMKLYADTPARFAGQLVGDLLFVCWVIAWIWVGNLVHDGTLALAEPGRQTVESASSLAGSFTDAGDSLGDLPVVGDSASAPFEEASAASTQLADAGRAEVEAVERLALWLGLSIAGIPVLVAAAGYLPRRVRFVRAATAGQRFIDSDADLELFALRAVTHQPMHVLARVTDDPVGALRNSDRATILRLAELQLRSHGLKAPRATAGRA